MYIHSLSRVRLAADSPGNFLDDLRGLDIARRLTDIEGYVVIGMIFFAGLIIISGQARPKNWWRAVAPTCKTHCKSNFCTWEHIRQLIPHCRESLQSNHNHVLGSNTVFKQRVNTELAEYRAELEDQRAAIQQLQLANAQLQAAIK